MALPVVYGVSPGARAGEGVYGGRGSVMSGNGSWGHCQKSLPKLRLSNVVRSLRSFPGESTGPPVSIRSTQYHSKQER